MWRQKSENEWGQKSETTMRNIMIYTGQVTVGLWLLFMWLLIILPFLCFVWSVYLLHAQKLLAQQGLLCNLFVCRILVMAGVCEFWYSSSNEWNVINKNNLECSRKMGDWGLEQTAWRKKAVKTLMQTWSAEALFLAQLLLANIWAAHMYWLLGYATASPCETQQRSCEDCEDCESLESLMGLNGQFGEKKIYGKYLLVWQDRKPMLLCLGLYFQHLIHLKHVYTCCMPLIFSCCFYI